MAPETVGRLFVAKIDPMAFLQWGCIVAAVLLFWVVGAELTYAWLNRETRGRWALMVAQNSRWHNALGWLVWPLFVLVALLLIGARRLDRK